MHSTPICAPRSATGSTPRLLPVGTLINIAPCFTWPGASGLTAALIVLVKCSSLSGTLPGSLSLPPPAPQPLPAPPHFLLSPQYMHNWSGCKEWNYDDPGKNGNIMSFFFFFGVTISGWMGKLASRETGNFWVLKSKEGGSCGLVPGEICSIAVKSGEF